MAKEDTKKEWKAPEGTEIVHYIWKADGKHAVYADPKKPTIEYVDPTILKVAKPVRKEIAQFIHA